MNPTKLSSSILEKLEKEEITPKPKWKYLLHSSLLGLGIILFLIIGILAAAVVMIFITELHLFQIFEVRVGYGFKALLVGFPLFWFATLIGLGFLVSFFAKKTETGHRHSLGWWLGGIILIQIIGGFALAKSPLGEYLEKGMEHQIWRSQNLNRHREQFWDRSRDGVLSGEVQEIQFCNKETLISEQNQGICAIVIRSRRENTWTVQTDEANLLRMRTLPEIGMRIRFIGENIDESNFKAFDVAPPRPPRSGFDRNRMDGPPPFNRNRDGRRGGRR